jgi:nucleotide-binding universal stress UspA family protein
MSPWQRILVHVDGSPRSGVRLRLARTLAAGHGAHVTAMLAADPPWQVVPIETLGNGGGAALMVEAQRERRQAALATVERERALPGAPVHWLEGRAQGAPTPSVIDFVGQALCSDLLVLGQRDPDDPSAWGVPGDFVPRVMAGSGRPSLLIPWAGEWTGWPRAAAHVLVAWKPTRESAAALTGALPLLRQAREVTVISWNDGGPLAAAGGDDPLWLRPLQVWLSAHGIDARVEPQGPAPTAGLGELLLSAAADHGADLLVMGCYGHTRMREWVFGGVTRTILDSMTLPVLTAR